MRHLTRQTFARYRSRDSTVERLMRQHSSDVKMPDLLVALVADCPRVREAHRQGSFSVYDRCQAVYERGSRVAPERC
jgi:hypothetical protein